MPLPPSVLLVGHDPQLVEGRRRLLENHGFKVYTSAHFPALNQTLEAHEVDLLILCHSLSGKECDRAVELVRARLPRIEVMALISASAEPSVKREELPDMETGLKSLLTAVTDYLKSHVLPTSRRRRRKKRSEAVSETEI
jgi:CheY-like chemotaxis protein